MYSRCETAEKDVGMLFYLTDSVGTGGRLKTTAEDFVVDEIQLPVKECDGSFTIADVRSINWETNRMIRLLARSLNISRERIGFAGTKDKRAVTTQRMSFECEPSALDSVDLKDISFFNIRKSNKPVRMGDLIGNKFSITARSLDIPIDEAKNIVSYVSETIEKTGGFPNYFGVQRFGTARPVTHLVGERIIKGDIKGAVETYLRLPSEHETIESSEAREQITQCLKDDDFSSLPELPKTMGYENTIINRLISHPGDYIGAIREMPSSLQMMFTHAYQSYLFNLMLSERMERDIPLNSPVIGDTVIPADADGVPDHDSPSIVTEKNIKLVERQISRKRAYIATSVFGSDGTFSEGEPGEIERKIIKDHGLVKEDFIVPGLPKCSAKGNWREILCPVNDLNYSFSDDSYTMRFSLTKGNYATCLLREFMKTDMHRY